MPRTRERARQPADRETLRSIWNGTVQIGPLRIPVGVATALSQDDDSFRQLHSCGRPISLNPHCPEHGQVPREEVVRGYEFSPGHFVVVDTDQAVPESKLIELSVVVDAAALHPLLLHRSYYLVPTDDEATRLAYLYLHEALRGRDSAAVGLFVMRGRDYPCAVLPLRGVLCLITLHLAEDLRSPKGILRGLRHVELAEETLGMLERHLDGLRGPMPTRLGKTYRRSVRRAIDEKIAAGDWLSTPEAERQTTLDLDAALKE